MADVMSSAVQKTQGVCGVLWTPTWPRTCGRGSAQIPHVPRTRHRKNPASRSKASPSTRRHPRLPPVTESVRARRRTANLALLKPTQAHQPRTAIASFAFLATSKTCQDRSTALNGHRARHQASVEFRSLNTWFQQRPPIVNAGPSVHLAVTPKDGACTYLCLHCAAVIANGASFCPRHCPFSVRYVVA